MEPSIYTTSVRDKIILVALIVFGVCSFISIWVDRSLGAVMVGIIGSIVAGLFGIYKGMPSTPETPKITEQSITQTTETKTEAGTETK